MGAYAVLLLVFFGLNFLPDDTAVRRAIIAYGALSNSSSSTGTESLLSINGPPSNLVIWTNDADRLSYFDSQAEATLEEVHGLHDTFANIVHGGEFTSVLIDSATKDGGLTVSTVVGPQHPTANWTGDDVFLIALETPSMGAPF